MNAPTKLGIALIVIFTACLLALFVELVYVLWRKRSFRQRSVVSGGARSIDSELSGSPFYAAPSKELLYFFCWKNQPARVEPSSGVVSPTPTEAATAPESEAVVTEDDDDELAKWQALYGQSRVLYTIKEEDREGNDSVENSADQSEARSEKRACLNDCLSGGVESSGDVAVAVDLETPFSTPCASPPYFTPSPSPDRDRDPGLLVFSPEIDEVSSPGNNVLSDREVGFVSLRIEG
ncbi:hypothetical protein like AT3G52480 [Hibiscus trionum]|uniref:Uncharacterized protein n=1 Tax=Hibiscus trionum TaxID=183268 RepID=A0A9W7IH96_HIBTR|nr:hypothetical protein like AT3G52480 [Hibiscus trionum]